MLQQNRNACAEGEPDSVRGSVSSGAIRMFVVIPLYNCSAEESAAFRTLQIAATHLPPERGSIRLLLYDNTPRAIPGEAPILPGAVEYHSTGKNDGLAAAYNFALELARRDSRDWLITLDQDTEVPARFLARIAAIAQTIQNDPSIAAIVPQITGEGRMLSPNWFSLGAIPRWFPKGYVGIPAQPTFAFNSASVLRVSALRQIRDYSPWFWLDNCDSDLFHRLHLYGKRVFVAGDVEVNHQFSMLDRKNRMSISRYRNALMAECAFWDLSMNRLAGWERTLRLVVRWCTIIAKNESPGLRDETGRAIYRRLFVSRRRRVEEWKHELESQRPTLKGRRATGGDPRPMISVCMATCDGERFIGEQLSSVLPQLGPQDEVIVVDDKSQDGTREVVEGFCDARIRLIAHRERQGIVSSFEHAVRSATGDILFLCDQDDVWAPTKVSKVMKIFSEQSATSLVASNFRVIDERGGTATDEEFRRRPFDHRLLPNLVSNRFQGSTMAFRASLLQDLLPFPKGCHVLHDAWIGLRNTLVGGSCYYLDEELLLYRRHAQNASRTLNLLQKLLKRLRLVAALVSRSAQSPPTLT